MPMPIGLRALAHRDYRLFWAGQLVSLIGTWMHFWLAAGALLVIGCSQIVFTASSNTTLQVTVPDRFRGRIMSLYALAFVGASPFGSFLVGAVVERFGVPAACAVGGGCGFALVTLLAIRWRRRRLGVQHPGGP